MAAWLAIMAPSMVAAALTAIWANDGGDKVARDELRASRGAAVTNRTWDGATVRLSGARNEVLGFALLLEAGNGPVSNLAVACPRLDGPGGAAIVSRVVTGADLFTWTNRNIELFLVRYLEIKGLSRLSYETYDERHIPQRFRRPWTGEGYGTGGWADRPDHNRFYPEIAVPLELAPSFAVASGQCQMIWCDIYVPRDAAPGLYTGAVYVTENQHAAAAMPATLRVRDFALPDVPTARTMVYLGYADLNRRYAGEDYPDPASPAGVLAAAARQRHFQLAHRHKLSLIDDNEGYDAWPHDRPRPYWEPVLSGALFSPAAGYAGPGQDTGNNVYSIGTYGSWNWQTEGATGMWAHTDAWASWFASHAPGTALFLYLVDESPDYDTTEQWAEWINANPGPGSNVMSMATLPLPDADAHTPALDIAASWCDIGLSNAWAAAAPHFLTNAARRFYLYNGRRPAAGSFATEDDGVALRALAWAQYKLHIDRWFFWESTYYNNFQGGMGQTRVWQSAFTFGRISQTNELGETGWNYSNGDGVLFYPGTDRVFTNDSYGCPGPFASLRMKLWRRGLQDVDYLAQAARYDPARVQALVQEMMPRAVWEYGVTDADDPTWVRADITWTNQPDRWEAAREELADIIEAGRSNFTARVARVAPAEAALTWNRPGPAFLYTVEGAGDLATDRWEAVTGAWPTAETNWFLPLGVGAYHVYRVRASYPEQVRP